MMCGADSIDDVNVLRAGGTPRVFDEVYAPSTLGIMLREFTFGHANQLAAVAPEHLAALAQRTPPLPGIEQRAFLRHRLAAAPWSTDTTNKGLRSGTPRSPDGRCCARACPR